MAWKGSSIALGHPVGASGARQVSSLSPEMQRPGSKLGVASMRVGIRKNMASLSVGEQTSP